MELTVQQAHDLAMQHLRAGRPADAEVILKQVLAVDPNNMASLLELGQLYYKTGRAAASADVLRKAVALAPRDADLRGNFGTVLAAIGHLEEAIAAFSSAIELAPKSAGLYSNLGNALQARGQYQQAVEVYRKAIELQPTSADAHNNLGTAFTAQDRKDEAIPEFRQALALRPAFVQALNNLGTVLGEKGKLDEAIECCLRAINLDPTFLGVYRNLGNSYRDAGQLDDAIAAYRKGSIGKTDAAVIDDMIIAMLLHPHLSREQVWQEHLAWNRDFAKPLAPARIAHTNDRDPNRRLKIGYVSPDFSEHPVGRFFHPLVANHDHLNYEIVCYSDTRRPDGLTEQMRASADLWRQTLGMPDDWLAGLVRQDGIDILVDLTMHTKRNRLLVFARKPAPVQVTYLAYPGTTGLETMDYRLTDPYLDPPDADQQFYSETSIRLPNSFWCYQPHRLAPPIAASPAGACGHITFGCLNLFGKMNAPMFELWARILNNLSSARLVLYCFEGSQRKKTLDFFASRGVASERVELVVRTTPAEYFARYHHIDIALDTSPFPGGTTTCDALWMGVPVVTLPGNTPLSRGGVSILSNIGLPELMAHSPDQYVLIATNLAADRARLAAFRLNVRDRMLNSPLMNALAHTRGIEAAYRQIWRRWCATPALVG